MDSIFSFYFIVSHSKDIQQNINSLSKFKSHFKVISLQSLKSMRVTKFKQLLFTIYHQSTRFWVSGEGREMGNLV